MYFMSDSDKIIVKPKKLGVLNLNLGVLKILLNLSSWANANYGINFDNHYV